MVLFDSGITCMLEIPRLILMLAILGIASYHDVRTREVPDYIWVIGGILGALLYIFDWNEVDFFVLFTIGTGCIIALLIWKFFPMGDADVLAILTVSVVYPVSFGAVMNPVIVFFGGMILEHMAAFFYNLRYNVEDTVRSRRIFECVEISNMARIMAFYSVHLRRGHEKFTFCAECKSNSKRKISLKTPSAESDYETRTGVFVTWAMPALPFMMASFVFGLIIVAFV